MPELDKVIGMSDYFGVSTDWLLRGVGPAGDRPAGRGKPGREWIAGAALAFGALGSGALWLASRFVKAPGGALFYGASAPRAASADQRATMKNLSSKKKGLTGEHGSPVKSRAARGAAPHCISAEMPRLGTPLRCAPLQGLAVTFHSGGFHQPGGGPGALSCFR